MQAASNASGGAKQKRLVRQCLQQLIKASILRGSIDGGLSVHDLVRDCMIRRADAACEGGLRATQREAVPLLLAAYDSGGPAAAYVVTCLHWHVRQARQPTTAIQVDPLIMSTLMHDSADIRKQGALGVGIDTLRDAADVCDKGGEHLEASQLMWAACAVRGQAAGAELKRAWASIRRLEDAGRGSSASRSLEIRVLSVLFLAKDGFQNGSDEHSKLLERMKELHHYHIGTYGGGGEMPAAEATPTRSKEAMDAEYGLALAEFGAALGCENATGYSGPMTHERVVQAHKHHNGHAAADLKAAALAPDEASEMYMLAAHSVATLNYGRRHALVEFDPVATFDVGGSRLRDIIDR